MAAVLGEAAQHPGVVLQPVPARHLDDQRRAVGNRGVLVELGGAIHPAAAAVLAEEQSRLLLVSASPARARIAPTSSGRISWFLGEKASIDGATSHSFSSSRPSQTKARREKTYASACFT